MKQTIQTIVILLLALMPMLAAAQKEKEVTIVRTDNQGRKVTLAGTLTTPEGRAPRGGWPAMVLITGSGQQNRDEEIFGHKPFLVIAQYMAAHGIATLRCDDRGVGGSNGLFADVTPYDFAADAKAEWQFLRKQRHINADSVGLLGHSEGGMLATMVAAEEKEVAFVVLMAAPGSTMRQTLLMQNMDIFKLRGVPDSLISRRLAFMRDAFDATDSVAAADTANLVKRLTTTFRALKDRHTVGLDKEQKAAAGLNNMECYGWATTMAQPYMRASLNINPCDYIARMRSPLLALGGNKDCQVNAGYNLGKIFQACEAAGIKHWNKSFSRMNHLFQTCNTGSTDEYATLGQSPEEMVLEAIQIWIEELNYDDIPNLIQAMRPEPSEDSEGDWEE